MEASFYTQLELLLRIIVSGICGAAIGYERKNRLKKAGVRTHFIVALASALIMIISKYGFNDILGVTGIGLDPSRVAAQIVTGVGFLGAGIIFIRKQSISGLTTAAGIWATSGVGMAIGAGLYFLGIASTLLIILVQVLLHRNFKWLKHPTAEEIIITMKEHEEGLVYIEKILKDEKIQVINMRIEKLEASIIEIYLNVKLPKGYNIVNLMKHFNKKSFIESIEL